MNRKNLGLKISKEAGKIVLKFYGKINKEISKSEKDFALEADLEAEKLIINRIKANFPDDSIISEEAGQTSGKSEYKWVIDPLDGTANFKARIPYFCVSIGVERNDKLIMAFVYDPLNKKLYFAEKNKGAYMNGKIIKVSLIQNMNQFLASYSTSNHKTPETIELGSSCFRKLLHNCRAIRLRGSSILDLCNLANGTFDCLIKVGASYWDFATGCLIVEEAGGKVTNFKGDKWNSETENLIASNGIRHNELLRILK